MLLPPPLITGDSLIAIAPSGTLRKTEDLEKGLQVWHDRGYKVVLEDNYLAREGYLAGNDHLRRQALFEAWTNPEYKAILCVRGGYGGARILEDWRWPSVNVPKWLIGFSDVTALLWSLYNEDIIGVHAPVLTTIADEPDWSLHRLFNYLEGRGLPSLQGKGWKGGKAKGKLLVGNLTVATHLLCTPVCPSFDNIILALEDVGEAPYRLDRMLTQWRLMNIFSRVKGILLGRFSNCDIPENVPSWTAQQVLHERLQDLNIPIITDLPFGHDGTNACLPVGELVEIDGDQGTVNFLNQG